ncbi:hypothetical protein EI613_30365 [Azospirillum sp. 412522]|nr:hypothetical protein [Azospirillum sp. 412522]MBY6266183.1 hypothetical protein [Azospirillum sp. 412522]
MGIIRFFGRDEMAAGWQAEPTGTTTQTLNLRQREMYRSGGNQQVTGPRLQRVPPANVHMTVPPDGKSAVARNREFPTGKLTVVTGACHSE